MKTVTCFLATLCLPLLLVSQCLDGWQYKKPFISKYYYHDLQAFDSVTAYAVGDSGTFLRTASKGQELVNNDLKTTDEKLNALHFLSRNTGWAAGNNGVIIHTSDRGQSWQIQNTGINPDLHDIYFTDSLHGVAVGEKGVVLHTTNGGKSWQQRAIPSQNKVSAVYFEDSLSGWLCGKNGMIYQTKNGGKDWNKQSSGTDFALHDIFFTSNKGWIVGNSGTLLQTKNGDSSWKKLKINVGDSSGLIPSYTSIDFVSDKKGWISDENNGLLHTTDGGKSWEYIGKTINTIDFTSRNRGFGLNGALKRTQDGGNSWEIWPRRIRGGIKGLHFINEKEGWMADGAVYSTKNGGKTWQILQGSGMSGIPEDVYFTKSGHGWVVNRDNMPVFMGTIDHSPNFGENWETQINRNEAGNRNIGNFRAVFFTDKDTGWAIGNTPILHTTDGGKNWNKQRLYILNNLPFYSDVFFENANIGWITGFDFISTGGPDTGAILRTENGGKQWNLVKIKPGIRINGIHFANTKYGWAVGESGLLWHSNDGGKNWQKQQSGVQATLNAVYAVDTNRVWAVGSGGTLLYTYNGGESWQKHEVNTANPINDLQFVNATTGWAAGDSGTFMRYKRTTPHATFAYDKTGATVNFYNTSINDSLFRWHFGDGATSQQSNPKHLYDSNGTYQACLIAENACGADTFCREVTVKSTGIKPEKSGKWQLQVFPNPVEEKATFQYRLPIPQAVTLTLTSTNGKVVKRIRLGKQQAGQQEQRINMSSLKAGIYYYKLQGSEHEQTGKLVKVEK